MMVFTIVSVLTFDRNDRSLFGYKAFVVTSDSMYKTDFDAGDLILIKEVNPATIKEGDIITYVSQNPDNAGETITHKVRTLTTDINGEPGFITYGTTTNTDDPTIVTYPYVLGKYEKTIPKVGTFFNELKTTQGYFVYIFVPFILLIFFEGWNCIRLFRRYKREQLEIIEAERVRIEAERAESAKMMEELLALRTLLEEQKKDGGKQDEPKE